MPGARYFLSLGGSFLLGLAVMVVAVIATWLLLPYLVPLFSALFPFMVPMLFGTVIFILIFIAVVLVVYLLTLLGVVIKYLFKPMKVSKDAKGYSVATTRESGLREKGSGMQQRERKARKRD